MMDRLGKKIARQFDRAQEMLDGARSPPRCSPCFPCMRRSAPRIRFLEGDSRDQNDPFLSPGCAARIAGGDVSSVTYARVCALLALPGGTVLVATEAPQSRSGIDRYTPEGAQLQDGSVQGMLAPVRSFCAAPMGRVWCGESLSPCPALTCDLIAPEANLLRCTFADRPCALNVLRLRRRAGLANGTIVVFDYSSSGNMLVPLGCWQAHPSAVVSATYLAPPAAAATPGGGRGFGRVFTLSEDGCIRGWSAGTPGPADDHAMSALSVRGRPSPPTLSILSRASSHAPCAPAAMDVALHSACSAQLTEEAPTLLISAFPPFRRPLRASRCTAK